MAIDELVESWDGEQVLCRHDRRSGAWMFVCIHSTALGPAGGGTRMRVYPSAAVALTDGLRLAAGMTRKMAAANLPVGGGKSIIAVPELPQGAERERLLVQYVGLVEAMGGRYITGPDMNTNMDDLDFMRRHSRSVFGSSESLQDGRSIAMATALGTFQGIRSCVAYADGSDALDGHTVLVQGVGEVGGPLTGMLVEAGAEVIGVEDVPRMGTRIGAGCANIQLRSPEAATALREAGILYGPDYVVNSGGAIHAFGVESLGWDSDRVLEHIAGIDDTLQRIFRMADADDISTDEAAERIVQQRLAAPAPTHAP